MVAIVFRQICNNHIDRSMKRHKMNEYSAEREEGGSIDRPAATADDEDGRQDDVQRRRRRLQQPPPVVMAASTEDDDDTRDPSSTSVAPPAPAPTVTTRDITHGHTSPSLLDQHDEHRSAFSSVQAPAIDPSIEIVSGEQQKQDQETQQEHGSPHNTSTSTSMPHRPPGPALSVVRRSSGLQDQQEPLPFQSPLRYYQEEQAAKSESHTTESATKRSSEAEEATSDVNHPVSSSHSPYPAYSYQHQGYPPHPQYQQYPYSYSGYYPPQATSMGQEYHPQPYPGYPPTAHQEQGYDSYQHAHPWERYAYPTSCVAGQDQYAAQSHHHQHPGGYYAAGSTPPPHANVVGEGLDLSPSNSVEVIEVDHRKPSASAPVRRATDASQPPTLKGILKKESPQQRDHHDFEPIPLDQIAAIPVLSDPGISAAPAGEEQHQQHQYYATTIVPSSSHGSSASYAHSSHRHAYAHPPPQPSGTQLAPVRQFMSPSQGASTTAAGTASTSSAHVAPPAPRSTPVTRRRTQSRTIAPSSAGSGGSSTSANETSWERRYNELIEYKSTNGHCEVPQNYAENTSLGTWVNKVSLICTYSFSLMLFLLEAYPKEHIQQTSSNICLLP